MRGSHSEDIFGQQMRPMAMTLTSEQAIADVSAYVNSLQGSVSETTVQGDVTAGKAAYRFAYPVMDQMVKATKP
ncbi:MAG: hypothetical protein Ct9H300mP28_06540 [Pseudomonadota bacterium]|nr:MAG: hypothetical protein Ct9H300mP28_06540 [Pseudomonadota bacterium]